MGQVQQEPLGGELCGVIAAVGSSVTDLAVGDRVCAAPSGAFATEKICQADAVRKVPDGISNDEAASIPIAFVTAYYSLIEVGRLGKDENVLIHAAAGGVGQAAIQIAQMLGAQVYATCGSAEKRNELTRLYGLPDSRIFNSRDLSFADGVMRATEDKGVDVVLNSLSGELLHASWQCLASHGRFVEIGKRDLLNNSKLAMEGFQRNCSFAAVDLGTIRAERPKIFNRVFNAVFDLFDQGRLKPLPVTKFNFSEIEAAFRTMLGGKHIGKIVIETREEDRVTVSTLLQLGDPANIGRPSCPSTRP